MKDQQVWSSSSGTRGSLWITIHFSSLIYLSTSRQNWPISVALNFFNGIYSQKPQLIRAGEFMSLAAPLLLFIIAQRFFIQGIVITGVEK
jgi:multiple sugar transport system permease protein